jgi:beta-glucosidase
VIEAASAIIAQFTPGMLGGTAFAEAIVGDINPSGKLTISMPRHVGQVPVYYNKVRGQHGGSYSDLSYDPAWAFGHGLSYSNFVYSDAKLNKEVFGRDDEIVVSLVVTNKGPLDGTEIVQIYVADLVTSATWPEQELKAFEKVTIKSGGSEPLKIVIKAADCSIVNYEGERVVENGKFELRVGAASDNIILKLPFAIN